MGKNRVPLFYFPIGSGQLELGQLITNSSSTHHHLRFTFTFASPTWSSQLELGQLITNSTHLRFTNLVKPTRTWSTHHQLIITFASPSPSLHQLGQLITNSTHLRFTFTFASPTWSTHHQLNSPSLHLHLRFTNSNSSPTHHHLRFTIHHQSLHPSQHCTNWSACVCSPSVGGLRPCWLGR